MPRPGCLKKNIELPPDGATCADCKDRYPKWHDKPAIFYGTTATPTPNCIHYCLKFKRRKPK